MVVAVALQLVVAIQCVTAIVLWLRHRLSLRGAGLCVGLFATVMLEAWAGRHMQFWLHLPIGVGIFVWLRDEGANWPNSYLSRYSFLALAE
jgi:hypothetical protein